MNIKILYRALYQLLSVLTQDKFDIKTFETKFCVSFILYLHYMKNFKKLFASVAIVAMLSTAVPTTVLGAASYSDELQGAYDYAYGIGITTQSSIDTANMYGSLLRSHMAKMMVNYAKEVKGMTPDTTKTCNFTDVANQTDELQGYIKEACQLGLMGVGITAFNPTGVVTRAQFGTVLDRVLNGDANDGGDPYYTAHLNALKDAGVMNNISNPNAPEVRGYVMLMMQRADAGTTPAVCETPENVLSCSLGLDTCPAECKTVSNEEKAGTLTVSTTAPDYTSIPAVGAVKHATIAFKAGSEDVKLYSVEMKKAALSTLGAATRMYFEKNGVRISGKATFSEDKATLSFNTAFVVKAGSTETVDLYLYVNGVAGDEYQFNSTKIDTSAADVNGTISTPLLKAVSYNVMGLTVSNPGTTYSYKVDGSKLVELGTFRLTTFTNQGTKDVTLRSVTINQYENASTSNLEEVALYRDDVKVSNKTIINGRDITFVLDDTIKYTKSSVDYVVKGKITNAERIGDKYQFQLKYPENMDIVENTTNFRLSITNGTTALMMSTMTINGADVKFNQPATSYTKQVVPGSKSVIFYTGTISSLSALTLEDLNLNFKASTGGSLVVRTIYAKIGNTVLSADAPTNTTGVINFNGSVTVNGTVPFVVYADIKDTAPAATVEFTDTVNLSSFTRKEFVSTNETATSSVGSLSPIKNNIVAANLSFNNTLTSTKFVQKSDKNVELANLEFSTTTDVVSKVYSFKATLGGTGNGNFAGGVVTVYDADGKTLVSDTITSGSAMTFVLPSALAVSKNNPLVLKVKLDQVANAVTASDYLKLTFNTIIAKDIITSNNITIANQDSALLDVVAAGTVTTVAQSFNPTLVKLNGDTTIVGTLKFKPYNGDAKLKTIELTTSGYTTTAFSKVVLKDSGTLVATFVKNGSNKLFAENIDTTLALDVTKTYDVEATLINATTAADLGTSFDIRLTQADFESMNGTAMSATTGTAVSSTIEFVKSKVLVSYVSSAAGANATYKIRVTANGGDVNLSSLSFAVVNNTDTTSGGALTGTLYLGNEGQTVLGTQNGATMTFAGLTQANLVNGEAKEFTLVIPVSNRYKGTNPGNLNVEVSNVSYADTFSNGSTQAHNTMFGSYKWDIAPVTTLVTIK